MSGDKISLTLDERTVSGKKVMQLRAEGWVPGVMYGHGIEPMAVQAPVVAMEKVYSAAGRHHPVHVTVGGKRRIALIKSADRDPVKHKLRHIAFHAVKQNEKVTTDVPIRLVGEGESPAEKAGLIVLQTLDAVSVKALPMDLPDALELSIVELSEPQQQVLMSDIKLPEGVEFEKPDEVAELTVASVYEPSALQAANEAAGGDAEAETEETTESTPSTEGEQTDATKSEKN